MLQEDKGNQRWEASDAGLQPSALKGAPQERARNWEKGGEEDDWGWTLIATLSLTCAVGTGWNSRSSMATNRLLRSAFYRELLTFFESGGAVILHYVTHTVANTMGTVDQRGVFSQAERKRNSREGDEQLMDSGPAKGLQVCHTSTTTTIAVLTGLLEKNTQSYCWEERIAPAARPLLLTTWRTRGPLRKAPSPLWLAHCHRSEMTACRIVIPSLN